jgi:hypothetical protein
MADNTSSGVTAHAHCVQALCSIVLMITKRRLQVRNRTQVVSRHRVPWHQFHQTLGPDAGQLFHRTRMERKYVENIDNTYVKMSKSSTKPDDSDYKLESITTVVCIACLD